MAEDVRITASVSRGAALLDQVRPGWLGEIDLITLNVESPECCVLGQLYGRYDNAPEELTGDDGVRAVEYGFIAHAELVGADHILQAEYRLLTEAWGDLIERRIGEEISGEAARVAASCCPCRGLVCEPGCRCADCPKSLAEVTDDAD